MATSDPTVDPSYRYSINEFTGDGTQTEWEINFAGGFISRDHVKAYITDAAGTSVVVSITWVSDTTITQAVPAGSVLTVRRATPKEAPLADFTDGSVVSEANLDTNANQAVFIAAEASDAGQEAVSIATRALLLPPGESADVPSVVGETDKYLGTDEDGELGWRSLPEAFMGPKGDTGLTGPTGSFVSASDATVNHAFTFTKLPQIHNAAGEATPINARSPNDGITVGPINLIHDGVVGDIFHLSTGGNTGPSRVVTDLVTTNGSPIVTSATANFTAGIAGVATDSGKTVTGTGIPAGASILTINSATQVTLTDNATATATGVTATLGSGPAVNTALIAMGVDNGGQGLAIRNKSTGIGLNIQQLSTVSAATSYAMIVSQSSAVAPAALFYQLSTKPSMRFIASPGRPANTPHIEVYTHDVSNNLAGSIYADSGIIDWNRPIYTRATTSGGEGTVKASSETPASASEASLLGSTAGRTGLFNYKFSGSAGLFYASGLLVSSDRVKLQVGTAAAAKGSETLSTVIEAQLGASPKLSFFGVTPVVRPTAYTQTYATADKTLGAYTPNSQSVAFTGAADSEAKLVDLNALRTAYENLRVFTEDLAQQHNSMLNDLRALGLIQ